jgi:transcriptional regulator with XRE-family HTH domain
MVSQNYGRTLEGLVQASGETIVGHVPRLGRLRDLRIQAAMTQIELADKASVARTTIIRLEAGDPNVNPSTLRKLARALKVRPVDLMYDDAASYAEPAAVEGAAA